MSQTGQAGCIGVQNGEFFVRGASWPATTNDRFSQILHRPILARAAGKCVSRALLAAGSAAGPGFVVTYSTCKGFEIFSRFGPLFGCNDE